ncbi:MAG TPA: MlaD family protein [Chitinivibrionales bacterium]|jgi:phospholipid/cholesterol/gamma-HCH transport system substrate-binding protein|nr:MlaD family protein [Chitinivibrionales bacterium]
MSDLTKAQRARLGIFVAAVCGLAFVLVAIPLGLRVSHKEKTYFAYFAGESMSGLEQGSAVKFHGVLIGKVAAISYDPKNLSRVKVAFKVQSDFPMKKDMYAQSWAMGITGLNYLDIMGGTNASPELPPNSEIPTKVSMLSSLTGKVDVIVAKVELLLNHLNAISEPDSLASIKKILDNLVTVTADAKSFFGGAGPDFRDIAKTARQVMGKIDSISTDIHGVAGTLNRSLSEQQISRIITRVDSTALSLKNLSETVLLMVKQNKEDISVSMENLREALENANQLAKELSENPSLLLKGEQQKEREH